MTIDKFLHAIECLRGSDSLRYDEGYHTLQGDFLRQHLDAVIELCMNETDPVVRGRLVELLGDSGDSRVVPLLELELAREEAEVRRWALHALDCLSIPEAQVLAASHRSKHPEDAQ